MRLEPDAVRATLADAWERWARRCAELTPQQWSTATRCHPWDVRDLVAHLCPDRSMFDMLTAASTDQPAAVTDAADMLRRFNAPGGIAHTSADNIAERAHTEAATLTRHDFVTRFTESAEILRTTPMSKETVISYPVVGTTTLAVVAEVALMEATRASSRPGRRRRRCAAVGTSALCDARFAHRDPRPDRGDRGPCRARRSRRRGARDPVTAGIRLTAN